MKNKDIAKMVVATLTSTVSGVIIGLLMAPEKGSSTRKKIVQEGDKYLQEIKKSIEELRQDLNKRAKQTKTEVDKVGEQAKAKGEDLLDKAKKLTSYEEWTKEELYKRAKQRQIHNYSTMNKAELIEALRTD